MAHEIEHIQAAASYVKSRFPSTTDFTKSVGVVLGSGLGDFPTVLSDTTTIPYDLIPNMPKVTVASHHGQLICGYIRAEEQQTSSSPLVLCFSGRVHSYEGIPWQEVCFQVRLLAALGTKLYIVTNATGGMLDDMVPGSLCLLTDHFRFMARKDPLSEFELPQEVIQNSKVSRQYWDENINAITRRIAQEENVKLFEGSYVWTSGPSFETPMEVASAKKLGGACVGMSTVPEVITAHAYGLSVLGISMVTNLAAGLSATDLNHEEVYTNANNSILYLKKLLRRVLLSLDEYLEQHKEVVVLDNSVRPITRRQFPKTGAEMQDALNETVAQIQQLVQPAQELAKKAYIVCSPQVEQTSTSVKAQISFLDLVKFPIRASGSNYGHVVINENNELIFVSGDEEGFTIEESAFIALLMYSLRIESVAHLIYGQTTNGGSSTDNKITEIFDLYHFHDTVAPVHPYLIYLNDDGSLGKRQLLFPYQSNQKHTPSYMSFCGPSEPSHGEYKMAASFGIEFVGTTSVATIYSSRYLGLNVSVHLSQEKSVSLSDIVSHLRQATNAADREVHFANLNFELLNRNIEQVSKLQVHYNDNISFEKLQDVATQIVTQLDQIPQLALLDYDLNLITELVEKRDATIVSKLNVASDLIGQDAHVFLLEHQGKKFFAVTLKTVGIDHAKQEEMRVDWTNYVRLFQHIGIKHIIFTQCFVGNDTSLLGKVVNIADHANLTGNNPMIGPNNDKYGPRFFDMSHVYSNILSSEEAATIPSVHCLQLPMIHSCRSHAEFKVARDVFSAKVVMSQAVRESIISQHCSLVSNCKCSMLGVVDEVVDVDAIQFAQKSVTEENKLTIVDLVLRQA